MDISNNTNKLVCRKCGGNHLSIKCGKDSKDTKPSVLKNTLENVEKEEKKDDKKEVKNIKIFKKNFNKDSDSEKESSHKFNRGERKPLHKVKMSNLPSDMTEPELLELLYDWGQVARLRVLNYNENSTAYVEFREKEEADYLCKALHKTPFEQIIIDVERLYD